MSFFTPQIIILAIAGFINLAMGIFIFVRGIKSKINLYFGLMTISNFFWTIFLIGFNFVDTSDQLRLFSSLPYLASYLVVVFLFYFCLHYPYVLFNISKYYKWLINISVILVVFYTSILYKNFVPNINLSTKTAYYNMFGHSIFALCIIVLMLASIIVLLKKIKRLDGYNKKNLKLILISVIFGTILGSYFNLFMIYVNNFSYIHIGPLFTLFINFVVFGFIVLPKEKISN